MGTESCMDINKMKRNVGDTRPNTSSCSTTSLHEDGKNQTEDTVLFDGIA